MTTNNYLSNLEKKIYKGFEVSEKQRRDSRGWLQRSLSRWSFPGILSGLAKVQKPVFDQSPFL